MASTFTYIPTYTSAATVQFRKKTVSFGDGYQQDANDGINTAPGVFDLIFDAIDNTTRDAIASFLSTQAGVQYFLWTPNYAGFNVQIKAKCDGYKAVANQWNNNTITCTFYQVFDF